MTRRVAYPSPRAAIEGAAADIATAARLAKLNALEEFARKKEAETKALEEELRRLRAERRTPATSERRQLRSEPPASKDALAEAFEVDLARRLGCRREDLI